MAFPTSSLTNNQVHKEGNRAFVYDSTLGVWDQVRETDRTENKIVSGTIGSGVTFPAGHILQIKNHLPSDLSAQTSSLNWPSTALGFDNAIQTSSDVLVWFFATFYKADTTLEAHTDAYFNGGGFASGTGGPRLINGGLYRLGNQYERAYAAYGVVDTNPGSTTPTYNIYFAINSSLSLGVSEPSFVFMEIAG